MIMAHFGGAHMEENALPPGGPGATRSQIYSEFIEDHKLLADDPRMVKQLESYARGLKVDVNIATYQELVTLLRKFLIWQMYG